MAKSPKKETTSNIALDMAKIFLEIQTSSFSSGVEEGKRQAQQELAARIDEKIKDLEEEKVPQSESTQEFDPFANYTDDRLEKHLEETKKLLDGDDE